MNCPEITAARQQGSCHPYQRLCLTSSCNHDGFRRLRTGPVCQGAVYLGSAIVLRSIRFSQSSREL